MKCEMRNVKLLMVLLLGWIVIGYSGLAFAQQEATVKQEKAAHKKAKKIRKRILRGADFSKMAQKYTDDPGSAATGGNLGVVDWGQFVPEFEEAVTRLELGELSEPVRTPFGYHIIQLIDRDEEQFHARHILVKPSIESP